jgi:hypothetical protein
MGVLAHDLCKLDESAHPLIDMIGRVEFLIQEEPFGVKLPGDKREERKKHFPYCRN